MRSDVPTSMPATQASPPPDAMAILRAGTATRHALLDAQLPIARHGATHLDYVRHLQVLYGWIEPLNDRLWSLPWPDVLQPARRRGKAALIAHDLASAAALGLCDPLLPALCPLAPQCDQLDARAVGVAYVIEGSQLGGAVLARRFAERGDAPVSYLSGYGSATGPMWRSFVGFVEETVQTTQHIAEALQGACVAFDTLTAWMNAQRLLGEATHLDRS